VVAGRVTDGTTTYLGANCLLSALVKHHFRLLKGRDNLKPDRLINAPKLQNNSHSFYPTLVVVGFVTAC
jgi:hypothetical protein